MHVALIALPTVLFAAVAGAASPATMANLGRQHRVLLISAPAADARVRAQRTALASWRAQAQERDLVPVEIIGDRVTGVGDTAASLRARYKLPTDGFALALVGKDGHVAFRSTEPVTAEQLEGTIDAMPMRRAGQR